MSHCNGWLRLAYSLRWLNGTPLFRGCLYPVWLSQYWATIHGNTCTIINIKGVIPKHEQNCDVSHVNCQHHLIIFDKIIFSFIVLYLKTIKIGFIPGMQGWFNISKWISISYHINKIQKSYDHLNTEKAFDKIQYPSINVLNKLLCKNYISTL